MKQLLIKAAEEGLLPDAMIRMGVRKLVEERLEQFQRMELPAVVDYVWDFIAQMDAAPIALNTQDANDQHSELPPEFFLKVLGPRLKYSSGLWEQNDNLQSSEVRMLETYCQRAELKDHQEILELGCGWGSLSLYMAEKFPDSRITAVSNSSPQSTPTSRAR